MSDASDKAYALHDRIDKQVAESWTIVASVQKTSDTGRSSTGATDDPELTLTVPTPGRYRLHAHILYKGGAGASAGNIIFGWNTGGVGTLRCAAHRLRTATGDWWTEHLTGGDTTTSLTDGTSNVHPLDMLGTWSVTSTGPTSTLTFTWGKSVTADGTTNTSVLQWSYFDLQRFSD